MKQKKSINDDKKLVQAFYTTNDPVTINEAIAWEARNFHSPLRQPGKPRAIALCSEFAQHSLLKHFPGIQGLREECHRNNVSMEYEYGLLKGDKEDSYHVSTIIRTDPGRPFDGFKKVRRKTNELPIFKMGIPD